MESIFWKVPSSFLPLWICPGISHTISCSLLLNFQLPYFQDLPRTFFQNSQSNLGYQNLYVGFPRLWTYCILFQQVSLSLNVFILWLGLLVWISSLREQLILTGVYLVSSYQCYSRLKGDFKHRSWQDQLKLNHIWQFYSKDIIFAIKCFLNQTYQQKFQWSLPHCFLIRWRWHGK